MQKARLWSVLTIVFILIAAYSQIKTAQATVIPNAQKQQVLVLQSYDPGMKWVKDIEEGLRQEFRDSDVYIFTDYMDVKRNPDENYLEELYRLYDLKFRDKHFSVIIACDDAAYNFLRAYQSIMFSNTPVVFCGVNFFDEKDIKDLPLFTGVEEVLDIKRTLNLALQYHPSARQVVVINGDTEVGVANKKALLTTLPDFENRIPFLFLEDMTMEEVQQSVRQLSSDSIILLMSFNKDKNNQSFTYEESLELIADNTTAPIYGLWDMYLGHGAVGGMMTNGYMQGAQAANIAKRIINGESPANIPVVRDSSTNRYMFDYNQLKRFHISESKLPPGSTVVNKPVSFYEKYKMLVWITGLIILSLLSIIAVLYIIIINKKKLAEKLNVYATTDSMTAFVNRRAGLELLQSQIAASQQTATKLTICFIDINNLKTANDVYGHPEGDRLIQLVCQAIKHSIRKSDTPCRFGGDEFLLICPSCDLQCALSIGSRIDEYLESLNKQQQFPMRITVSHGFAEYDPYHPISLSELIQQADDEMYRQKNEYKEKTGIPDSNKK